MERNNTFICALISAGFLLVAAPAVAQDGEEDKSENAASKSQKGDEKGSSKASDKAADEAKANANDSSAVTGKGEMKIVKAETASGVEEREPTGTSDSFSTGDNVTVWLAVRNPEEASNVTIVWKRDGNKVSSMDLEVGKSWRWRTWGRIKVINAGDWSVDIQDPDGKTLKTVEFEVSE